MEFVAPLSVGAEDDAAAIAAHIDAWRAAGATSFHVGFAHRSLEHLLERLEHFAAATHLASPP
jgi:hypothetical protein